MLLRILGFAFVVVICAGSPARAQNYASYVSSSGSDNNSCSLTSPCSSFNAAQFATRAGGSISCISAPASGLITITKSITIDCSGVAFNDLHADVLVTINLPTSDVFQSVRLKGYTINGGASGTSGVEIVAAGAVFIEDMRIIQESQHGIYDHRTGGGSKLFITDSTISGNGGPSIALGGGAVTAVVLNNVKSFNNSYGLAAAAGNVVSINRSEFANNTTAGIEGDSGAQISVDGSRITGNSVGIQSSGSVRVSNSDISFNSTAISGSTGSFGNNRFSGNSAMGSGLTALGPNSSDLGQQ